MKKLPVVIVAALAVLIVSFLWVRSRMGETDPARMAGGDAVAFVALPDLPRTALRWPGTALARIGAEAEMKAFLEKPMGYLTGRAGGGEAAEILRALKPGRIFAAAFVGEGGAPGVLIGFQYWGGRESFERAMARLLRQASRGTVESGTKEGDLSHASWGEGEALFWGTKGGWGFVGNTREPVVNALSRAAGTSASPSLAESPDFAKVSASLTREADLLGFLRPGPLLDAALSAGAAFGFEPDERQVAQVRKTEAAGYALKLDGADLRETMFILRPDPPELQPLSHLGMAFASPQTLAYFDFVARVDDLAALLESSPLAASLPPVEPGAPGPFSKLPDALTGEASISVNWPADRSRPHAVGIVGLRDPALAGELLMAFAKMLPEIDVTEREGVRFYRFPSLNLPLLDPAVAIRGDVALLGLGTQDLEDALSQASAPERLDAAPIFKPALAAYRGANETFGFVDARGVFERVFPLLRQVIVFGVAIMPGAGEIVDATKLPQTESVARHLAPIVYAQTRVANGYLIESSGPITMLQLAALAGGAGTRFVRPDR